VEVIEYYASSELSLISLTPRGQWREAHVGRVLEDVIVKLADDGEVLVKSPAQMPGYLGQPELTLAACTDDGFFMTGDLGVLTPDGYLKLQGRKLDAFNTPAGANIYPERIEAMLESLAWVRQAILVGDQRPYVSALIVLGEAVAYCQAAEDGYADPSAHAVLYDRVREELRAINAGLEPVEQIARFAIFTRPFGHDILRLVGQAKVRKDRRRLETDFYSRIRALYAPVVCELDALTVVPDVRRSERS
jgi:long-chain acyl-CoA synthetase